VAVFAAEQRTEIIVVRCLSCDGLRAVEERQARRQTMCKQCAGGRVVPRSAFFDFWRSRFTDEELEQMARAIWSSAAG
jgi:hypothetical protein